MKAIPEPIDLTFVRSQPLHAWEPFQAAWKSLSKLHETQGYDYAYQTYVHPAPGSVCYFIVHQRRNIVVLDWRLAMKLDTNSDQLEVHRLYGRKLYFPLHAVPVWSPFRNKEPTKFWDDFIGLFAYDLANRGADTRLIQDYLGRQNIQHTVRYTELSPTRFANLY